jgi:hypothetical protein
MPKMNFGGGFGDKKWFSNSIFGKDNRSDNYNNTQK